MLLGQRYREQAERDGSRNVRDTAMHLFDLDRLRRLGATRAAEAAVGALSRGELAGFAFLADVEAGGHRVENLLPGDYRRVRELCDRYADADIGFVDAAVLAIVERLNEPKLATLDQRLRHATPAARRRPNTPAGLIARLGVSAVAWFYRRVISTASA